MSAPRAVNRIGAAVRIIRSQYAGRPGLRFPGAPLTINSPRQLQRVRQRQRSVKSGRLSRCNPYSTYSSYQEASMLSAHEFATLMLVKDSVEQIADRAELDTLLERQLVVMEQLAGGAVLSRVTKDGDSLLRIIARTH